MSHVTYLDLFSEQPAPPPPDELARSNDTTSLDAAKTVSAYQRSQQQQDLIDVLEVHGPLTDEQMVQLTAMNPNSQRPRRRELEKAGVLCEAGEARTASGRKAKTWGLKR